MSTELRASAEGSTSAGLAIGVDIGGSKAAAGVVDEAGRVVEQLRRPTPRDAAGTEDVIAELVQELSGRHDVGAVGVGAAGWVGSDRATVLFSPHLAWRDEPLRAALRARLGVPVVVENDANAAAWAEYCFGGGRGEPVLLCVTLGTGIGGGLVVDGELFRGRFGLAGEWGHLRVVPDGRACACGNRGCWEEYVSGRALAWAARELAESSPAVAAGLLERVEGDPTRLLGEHVTAAAQAGDRAALDLLAEAGRWLGQGIADLAAILDPGTVVIGGGLSELGELLLEPARERYAAVLTGRGYRPELTLRTAELGPAAGLIGAADLARRRG
ncbi:MAG: ROK family glucokinase [Geodermatophilaceae bacterium]|nr:ROK family glucokinase [Geodermatophilaceae bacterium]